MLIVAPGARRTDIMLTIWKLATVSGKVTDAAGVPLTGDSVTLFRPTLVAGTSRLNSVAMRGGQIDDRGDYRIFNLIPGEYAVGYRGRGAVVSEIFALLPGEHRSGVDFRIAPVSAVRVAGVLHGRDPQARAIVQLLNLSAGPTSLDASWMMVRPDGTFSFDGVVPGRYAIRAAQMESPAPGASIALAASAEVVVGSQPVDGVALSLERSPRVTGRIEFAGTSAPPSAEQLRRNPYISIEVADGSTSLPALPQIRISDDGQFVSTGLMPGRYLIGQGQNAGPWSIRSALAAGRDLSMTPFNVGADDVSGVVVVLTDRSTGVAGFLRDPGGQAIPDAHVVVFPVDRSLWVDTGRSSRRIRGSAAISGFFSLNVPPGDYYIAGIPGSLQARWRAPDFLSRLAAVADRITLIEGERPRFNPRFVSIK
jgi:hypothetical protein